MKIYLHTYDKRYSDRIQFIKDCAPILFKKHNIEFVDSVKICDIIISQQVGYNPDLSFIKQSKKDVIILEVNDTATIFNEEIRKFIKEEKLKGFFKLTNFKDLNHHNSEITTEEGRYHANLMDPEQLIGKRRKQSIVFSDNELEKIVCAIPGHMNFRMNHIRNAISIPNLAIKHERPIDVNFAGTTDYTKNKNYVNLPLNSPKLILPKIIADHRIKCLRESIKLKEDFKRNVLLADHKPMNQPQYWNSLYNSKICLSPWGFGGYNWRDYESIYLGALLIKPDTDFLETYCNIYRSGKTYVSCCPRFTNLVDVVNYCLDNFIDYQEMISFSHKNLKENENIEKISDRLALQIKNCVKE